MILKNPKQQPIDSPFGAKSTAMDVIRGINLKGKNIIITGGYSGIGLEMTKAAVSAGGNVLVPVRNPQKAASTLKGLPNVTTGMLNLMNPDTIDAFAQDYVDTGKRLDILICNAGIMFPPLRRDARGYESQFSTNYLGHFQLTAKLWPALKGADGARVVIVTSRAQRWGGVHFDDPSFNHSQYTPKGGYAQSKTADVLFAVELDDRAKEYGVRAFAAHPGPTPGTNLGSGSLPEDASGVKKGAARALPAAIRFLRIPQLSNLVQRRKKDHHVGDEMKTVPQGAATPLWCAVSPQLAGMGGVYCEDCNIAYAVDDPESPFGVLPWAIDPELAKKLWIMGEAMTGVAFDL